MIAILATTTLESSSQDSDSASELKIKDSQFKGVQKGGKSSINSGNIQHFKKGKPKKLVEYHIAYNDQKLPIFTNRNPFCNKSGKRVKNLGSKNITYQCLDKLLIQNKNVVSNSSEKVIPTFDKSYTNKLSILFNRFLVNRYNFLNFQKMRIRRNQYFKKSESKRRKESRKTFLNCFVKKYAPLLIVRKQECEINMILKCNSRHNVFPKCGLDKSFFRLKHKLFKEKLKFSSVKFLIVCKKYHILNIRNICKLNYTKNSIVSGKKFCDAMKETIKNNVLNCKYTKKVLQVSTKKLNVQCFKQENISNVKVDKNHSILFKYVDAKLLFVNLTEIHVKNERLRTDVFKVIFIVRIIVFTEFLIIAVIAIQLCVTFKIFPKSCGDTLFKVYFIAMAIKVEVFQKNKILGCPGEREFSNKLMTKKQRCLKRKLIRNRDCEKTSSTIKIILNDFLQKMVENINNSLMVTIQSQIHAHKLSQKFIKFGNFCNKSEDTENFDNALLLFLNKTSNFDAFQVALTKISNNLLKETFEASKQLERSEGKLAISVISNSIKWSTNYSDVLLVKKSIYEVLEEIDENFSDLLNLENRCTKFETSFKDASKIFEQKLDQHFFDIFKTEFLKTIQRILQQQFGEYRKTAIHILLRSEEFVTYETNKNHQKFNELKSIFEQETSNFPENCCPDVLIDEYNMKILNLFVKTRSSELFAKMVRENIPMDLSCVYACSLTLPKILNLPGISIEVAIGDIISHKFASGTKNDPTIKLKLENEHFEVNNQIFTQNSDEITGSDKKITFDCLFDALSNVLPLNQFSAEKFRNLLADSIESDSELFEIIQSGYHSFFFAFGGDKRSQQKILERKINKEAELLMKHQHHSKKAFWYFRGDRDIDLRDMKIEHDNYKSLNRQWKAGFKVALAEINRRFGNIQSRGKVQKITSNHFEITKYDVVMHSDANDVINPALFPVELKSRVLLKIPNTPGLTEFQLVMDLDNPIVTPDLEGPHGPHVGYEIKCQNSPKGFSPLVGHVLLNKYGNELLPGREGSKAIYNSCGDMHLFDTDVIFDEDVVFDEPIFRHLGYFYS